MHFAVENLAVVLQRLITPNWFPMITLPKECMFVLNPTVMQELRRSIGVAGEQSGRVPGVRKSQEFPWSFNGYPPH
tara:strand:- start:59 stop:286 length:228 start_codon:yes stop_codon:yes gene_type:complete